MKIMQAKILDATHLELSQPIAAHPGDVIVISIPDEQEEDQTWQEAPGNIFWRRTTTRTPSMTTL